MSLAEYGGLEVGKTSTETTPSETTLAILLKVLTIPETLSTEVASIISYDLID